LERSILSPCFRAPATSDDSSLPHAMLRLVTRPGRDVLGGMIRPSELAHVRASSQAGSSVTNSAPMPFPKEGLNR
jgi:hypothetical protein